MSKFTFKNVMVMGAGAVGGYFGGKLSGSDDVEVSFVARGEHLEMMQKTGLTIKSSTGELRVRGPASGQPGDLPEPDLILFTVKSYDTSRAIEQINPVVGRNTQILTLQNGIENIPKLVNAFGEHRVIRGICRIGVRISEPGTLVHTHPGSIWIGERDGSQSYRTSAVCRAYSSVGVECTISENIEREIWRKFSWNAIFNMVSAAMNKTTDYFFKNGEPVDLLWKLADELLAVAKAEQSGLVAKDFDELITKTEKFGAFVTSTLHDRRTGKPLEYDAFTGALLRLGKRHGIHLPEYRKLHQKLEGIDRQVCR